MPSEANGICDFATNEMIIKEMRSLNQILLLPTNENLDIENWLKGNGNYQRWKFNN